MGGFSVVPDQVINTAEKIEDVARDVRATAGALSGAGEVSGTAAVIPYVTNAIRMINHEVGADFEGRADGIEGFGQKVRHALQNYVGADHTVASSYSRIRPS